MTKRQKENIKVFALGGVGEIGKNMYVVEVDSEIFIIDSGLMFPEDEMLGIDIVIPDISYLEDNADRIFGIFLTHGHEDHIGGLPYVLKKISVPVYATKLTLGLVGEKLAEAGLRDSTELKEIDSNTIIYTDKAKVTFFRTSHSIPDSVGICVHTTQGAIVHTGDFKFDQTPVDGKHPDYDKMSKIGNEGVLCLLSDSTNAEKPGSTGSEMLVGEELSDVFYNAEGRVIVASFASNVHRIQQVFDAAVKNNRKVAVIGRSMVRVVDIALKLGYLNIPDDVIIPLHEVKSLSSKRVALLSTGSQGEPMSALTRMANRSHRQVTITEGDTVVIAATPIPGNEKSVSKTIDLLFRSGAEVIYGQKRVHVSGHGSQEELKLMLNFMKPTYFMPVHGEYRMQIAHASLAESTGVLPENIFVVEKGETVEFVDKQAKRGPKVPSGNVLIDGLGVGDVGNIVLRDRRMLSQDGILVVVVTLSKSKGIVVSGPEIISRGFVYVRESEKLMETSNKIVADILQKCMDEKMMDWSSLKTSIRESLNHFLYEKTRRKPMIMPIIMEI